MHGQLKLIVYRPIILISDLCQIVDVHDCSISDHFYVVILFSDWYKILISTGIEANCLMGGG